MDAPCLSFDYLPEGNCPVQSEGFVNGVPFYFRSRGNTWSFSVGKDPILFPDWTYSEPYGETTEAGWITEEEAVLFIYKAVKCYNEAKRLQRRKDELWTPPK